MMFYQELDLSNIVFFFHFIHSITTLGNTANKIMTKQLERPSAKTIGPCVFNTHFKVIQDTFEGDVGRSTIERTHRSNRANTLV